jgi:hypothetical protein
MEKIIPGFRVGIAGYTEIKYEPVPVMTKDAIDKKSRYN